MDIIETYVEYEPCHVDPPEWIYFRIRTANAEALAAENHLVSAYLDCEPYGEDFKDLNVFYSGFDDQVVFGDGFHPNPDSFSFYGPPPRPEGERPADELDTVE